MRGDDDEGEDKDQEEAAHEEEVRSCRLVGNLLNPSPVYPELSATHFKRSALSPLQPPCFSRVQHGQDKRSQATC